ncbi:MAG: papain-like cysteine protease family protein [Bacteroidota bacterium]
MLSNIEYVISSSEDIEEILVESVRDYFLREASEDPDMEKTIGEFLDGFREDLYFVVEYPYVDKVYRDSYYSYYASKHSAYQRDCIRVLIFEKELKIRDFSNPKKYKKLQDDFLGYFVLRPLRTIIGRSLINPVAFENKTIKICLQKSECLVLGIKLTVAGFPHSSQDSETITCAETTIWSAMEYFGTRYSDYKPVLPSTIIKTMERIAVQRQLPSNGLTMEQISFALKQFGFGTRIYSKEQYDEELFDIIDAYIESGIPVMTGLESDEGGFGHVVVLIGKQYQAGTAKFKGIKKRKLMVSGKQTGYHDIAQLSSSYVIQDDNLAPYQIVTLDKPGAHYQDSASRGYKIDTVVVPLYPKIYLEAYVAKNLMLQILKDAVLGYQFKAGFVLRCFLASSRSFKNHIAKSATIGREIRSTILLSKMPKFIWVAEIYGKNGYVPFTGEAEGLVVLDATEANSTSVDTLILAAYPDRSIAIDQNKFITLEHILQNYSYYSNLQ